MTIGSVNTRGGLVILHGNNTYAGGTAIVADTTLEVFQDSNLGAFDAAHLDLGSVSLSDGGTLLTATDGFATGRAITTGGNGTLAVAAGTSATYSGVVSGGALSLGSSGNTGLVSLTGTNTFTGGTSINGATLKIAFDASLGATTGGVSSDGGELVMDFSGTIRSTRSISLANGSTLAATTGHAVTLGSVISGDTITIGDGNSANNGTIVLSGHNTYNGNTRIDGATLQISSETSLGSGDVELFHSGKLVGAANELTITHDMVVDTSGGTVAAAAGTSLSYNGRIAGGGLTIGDATNTGTVTLAGNNTYFNDTVVAGGTLLLTGRLALSPVTTVQSGATLAPRRFARHPQRHLAHVGCRRPSRLQPRHDHQRPPATSSTSAALSPRAAPALTSSTSETSAGRPGKPTPSSTSAAPTLPQATSPIATPAHSPALSQSTVPPSPSTSSRPLSPRS